MREEQNRCWISDMINQGVARNHQQFWSNNAIYRLNRLRERAPSILEGGNKHE